MKEDKDDELKKAKRICEVTLKNCIHTKKRLNNNDLFSKFILNYYSIFLIILTITGKYFPTDKKILSLSKGDLSDYFSLIFSIILLIFSIINSNSKYEVRVENLDNSINQLKTLKRTEKNTEKFWEKYNEIVDNTEMRTDTDFYYTVKELCAAERITGINFYFFKSTNATNLKIIEYRETINVFYQILRNLLINFLKLLLLIIPIIIFIICL